MTGTPIDMRDFDFRVRRPEDELNRFVESLWYARGTVPYRREQIAPTGSCVAVFVLGPAILEGPLGDAPQRFDRGFLIGPHDRPVVNEPTGETHAIGIVTTTVGCRPLFGVAPAAIRRRVVDLETVWSAAAGLRAALSAEADPDAALTALEGHLRTGVDHTVGGLERCEAAVARLESDPTVSIARIAETAGISHAHLDREFDRLVGLTPRVVARILRLRRMLEALDTHGSTSWSSLAADLGWFDQAHLIRDFKRHTGVTPTDYVERQRRFAPRHDPAETAGFVPDHEAR